MSSHDSFRDEKFPELPLLYIPFLGQVKQFSSKRRVAHDHSRARTGADSRTDTFICVRPARGPVERGRSWIRREIREGRNSPDRHSITFAKSSLETSHDSGEPQRRPFSLLQFRWVNVLPNPRYLNMAGLHKPLANDDSADLTHQSVQM